MCGFFVIVNRSEPHTDQQTGQRKTTTQGRGTDRIGETGFLNRNIILKK